MTKSGKCVLDFGSGAADVSTTVLDPDITSAARISASIVMDATDTHTADEHALEPIRVVPGSISAGSSFVVRGVLQSPGVATGTYRVNWFWSDT